MSTTPSTTIRRFPLHWVFKIGSLDAAIRFYHSVFGMKIHRHEEFGSGCEATCNGPYGGAWSKTMIGYGTEITNTSLELTYNYGIDKYELGNDYRYIAIAAKNFGENALRGGFDVTALPGGYQIVTSPDGYKFLLVPGTEGSNAGDPFLFVSLHVTHLAASVKYYTETLGFKILTGVPGALNVAKSTLLGFDETTFKLELVELPQGITLDHKKGIGRMAIETDDDAPIHVAEKVKAVNGKINHGPFKLPPHDEHVIIVADPDGYEYCFVGLTGYRNGSLSVKTTTIDWDYRNKKVTAATEKPSTSPTSSGLTAVVGQEQYNAMKKTTGKLVVVKFFAQWCQPCKKIASHVVDLSRKYSDRAVFFEVDIDENNTVEDVQNVPRLPAFKFFKDGVALSQLEGVDLTVIEGEIKKFL